ncbi:hypothetical protein U1Q18_003926 [Sarracenia purpurea var. burkii]
MFRDFKFLRRDPGKNSNTEEVENVPVNSQDLMVTQTNTDSSRAPLNTIQEPIPNSKSVAEQEVGVKITKIDRTPTKAKTKVSNNAIPLRTPEKPGISAKNRFGWVPKNESSSFVNESRDEGRGGGDMTNYTSQSSRGIGVGNGSFANLATPRPNRAVGRANSSYSDCNSTQSTPTKSVTKPPNPGLFQVSGSRPHVNAGGPRVGNYAALSKGLPISCSSSSFVNTVEVPHFVLKEDPSFWMEHSVQVLIRIRPLNSTERNLHGYNRCLKQESAQCITWIGQPETRFTFDHVACETVDQVWLEHGRAIYSSVMKCSMDYYYTWFESFETLQETLFRMVGLPMVENCLSGYNSCMFAYGQVFGEGIPGLFR